MPKMSEAKNVGITDVPKETGPQYHYLVVLGELPDGLVMRYEAPSPSALTEYLANIKSIIPAEHDLSHGDFVTVYRTLKVASYEVYTTLALDDLPLHE